jgi:tRNA-dihydrouridine synthase B
MHKHWDNPQQHPPTQTRVPASLRIGNVDVSPATVLAPMVGVTDTVFRRFIRNASLFTNESRGSADTHVSQARHGAPGPVAGETVEATITNQQSGCGLLMTEFTSADGLSRMRESKRKRYLTYYDDEHPISAQLFGSDPNTMADAARIVQDAGFDMVDLNLGCPAKRVVACNGGSGLLRDLPKIETIFKAIRSAVTIPFTVKIRMGWNDQNIVCVPLAKLAEDSGLQAIALHARTREDGYTGHARWEYIAAVKDAVSIPVIGNGDIRTPEDASAMVEQTGCDAVMIGRAAPANPWIFRQIAQYTATGRYDRPTEFDRYRMIRAYFEMLLAEIAIEDAANIVKAELNGNAPPSDAHRDAAGKMKQFAAWFTHGVPGGSGLRKSIFEARRGSQILDAVDRFFEMRMAEAQANGVHSVAADVPTLNTEIEESCSV